MQAKKKGTRRGMQYTNIYLGISTHLDLSTGEFDGALESRQQQGLPPCGQRNHEDFCMNFPCARPGYGSCAYPDQNCCRKGPQVGFKSISIDIFFFQRPFVFHRKPRCDVKPTASRRSFKTFYQKIRDDEASFFKIFVVTQISTALE